MISKILRLTHAGRGRWALLAVVAVSLSGCTDWAGYDLDYLLAKAPFIGTMRRTVAFRPQTMPRLPAPGSVPVQTPNGASVPLFPAAQLDSAAATLVNPVAATPEVLARGEQVYGNLCFACHGTAGAGNGPVVGGGRFPMGPQLNGAAAAARSDGYLFAIMRVGRGLMPPYADRISENDQWAVVHYLRQLQGGASLAVAPTAP